MLTNLQRHRRISGFSLVEIMVGLAIGMIGTLVIYEVFAVSEANKRTTTNTNDAQFNGMVALMNIDRDARQAGFGYVSDRQNSLLTLGCNVLAYNAAATPTSINFRLAPILITDGGAGLPDAITITYGNSSKVSTPVQMAQPVAGTPNYQVRYNSDRIGFEVGDTVLAAQANSCLMGVITAITGPLADVMNLTGGQSPYNPPGGFGVNFNGYANLFNLGTPTIVQYSLTGPPSNSFVISDLKQGAAGGANNTLALADNIVSLQAQYGIDTNGDGFVDSWQEPTGPVWGASAATPSAPNLLNIRAVRVGIVARSTLKEKATGPGGTCVTTISAPVIWADVPALVDLSADPDWKCYRYKVYQTVIPIRNMLWS